MDFSILGPIDLLSDLIELKYINKIPSSVKGVSIYSITQQGIEFLNTDFDDFSNTILTKFPDKEKFINILLRK